MREKLNIRSPEERYGGEGHAGTDPFASETPGPGNPQPDPSVEMPDATVEELVEIPEPASEQTEDEAS